VGRLRESKNGKLKTEKDVRIREGFTIWLVWTSLQIQKFKLLNYQLVTIPSPDDKLGRLKEKENERK